ncbi:hypothetical protein EAO73_27170 [Streptomyces sp. col6]|nr:hypothetical protein EAO73_27170 [Streptomyces sp. col6]
MGVELLVPSERSEDAIFCSPLFSEQEAVPAITEAAMPSPTAVRTILPCLIAPQPPYSGRGHISEY